MNRAAICLTLGLAAGCVAKNDPPPPFDNPPPCEATASPPTLALTEGARGRIAISLSDAVTAASVADPGAYTAVLEHGTLSLRAPYELVGEFIVKLALQCGERTGALEIPVSIHRFQWTRLPAWTEGTDGPLTREYGAFFVDPADANSALLYGGFVFRPQQFTPATDAWRLNLATGSWSQLSVTGPVPPATGGRVAVNPGSSEALYLGGVLLPSGDTPYVLSRLTTTATALTFSDAPSTGGRGDYQPGFFFDAKRNRYLSLCGANDAIGWHCEVRALGSDGAWTTVATAGAAPEGRNGHFYAYDAENDRVVMFGGDVNGSTLGDTWALELSESTPRWVQLAYDYALRRRNGAWVLDEANHRLVVWGGTQDGATAVDGLWILPLDRGRERWIKPVTVDAPPNRASGAAIYDGPRGRMVAGLGNSNLGVFADLWELKL